MWACRLDLYSWYKHVVEGVTGRNGVIHGQLEVVWHNHWIKNDRKYLRISGVWYKELRGSFANGHLP